MKAKAKVQKYVKGQLEAYLNRKSMRCSYYSR